MTDYKLLPESDNWESFSIGDYTVFNKVNKDDEYTVIKTDPLVIVYKNKNFDKVKKRLKELVSGVK